MERGVEITPAAKRAIYLTFFLSYLLTLISVHGALPPGGEYAAVQPYKGGVYHLLRLSKQALKTKARSVLHSLEMLSTPHNEYIADMLDHFEKTYTHEPKLLDWEGAA